MKGFWTIAIVKWILILIIAAGFSWMPIVSAIDVQNSIQNKKGLALTGSKIEDVEKLGANWFYVYSVWESQLETVGYVPMLRDGMPDVDLPNDYDGYILIFNEPTWPEPYGINISAEEGSQRYLALLNEYEDATLVVGGFADAGTDWVREFLSYLDEEDEPDIYHVHHYFGNEVDWAINDIVSFHDFVDKPLWVTEFGSYTANPDALREFLFFLETSDWIARYSYFPTRIPQVSGLTPDWWPVSWDMDMALVEWESGELTVMGETFRDYKIYKMYIPLYMVD